MRGIKLWLPPDMLHHRKQTSAWTYGVLLFTMVTGILTGIVFGLVPALSGHAARSCRITEGRWTNDCRAHTRHRMRTALVVAEVALSFVLLEGRQLA